ncbi:hypothetical protein [Piscinibacter sp. XHJ-5]|uniref:hypothetical protein n=1 Tax=Piscinibacter sp. XHJ-5 TaxID=3037797 RepID=UPI002453511E|nr:hypothetical protein [Piscinibacter sp. XHJ-5]
MFKLLFGIAVGMVVANALQRKNESARRPAARGVEGGVDELTSAADHLPTDTSSLNAGDGTPSARSASGRAQPAIGETSNTFNAA